MARLLAIVKPWGLPYQDEILGRLDALGERLVTVSVPALPLERIAEHYHHRRNINFFDRMVSDYAGRPATFAVYEGDAQMFDKHKDAIRFHFRSQMPEIRTRWWRNVLHVSDNQDAFGIEATVWRDYLPTHILPPHAMGIETRETAHK